MTAFEELKNHARYHYVLNDAVEVLSWDQEVMMPPKGVEARAEQMSMLEVLGHEKIQSEELEKLIENVEERNLSEDQQAVLREVKRVHKRAKNVPIDLVKKISEKQTETVEKWRKAKEENDFTVVEDDLEELVELQREYARQVDEDEEPYKVLFREYEPYIELEDAYQILQQVKDGVKDLLDDLNPDYRESRLEKEVSEENQEALIRSVLELVGFEDEKMRLDESEHPFTHGNQFDTRITTNYGSNLEFSLMSSIHEMGHALYQLGLPQEEYGNPLGSSREMIIHESQSRIWGNNIARSRGFSSLLSERIRDNTELNVEQDDVWRSLNRIKPENTVRIKADEVTYHLHIVLRMEIERQLINGDIEVSELPEIWNHKSEEILGVRPENDSEGVLQDIHWYWGSFGYFPTYSLGSLLASQLYRTAEEQIEDLNQEKINKESVEELREWLRDEIHSKGQKLRTQEMIEEATGKSLEADDFLEYAENKYKELY